MSHKTSIISMGEKISNNVEIGPYSVIGPNVLIGKDTKIHSHVSIMGNTTIGSGNEIFPFACIGNDPQDLKYQGEENSLIIGNNNKIREYVNINPGTKGGGGKTKIGKETKNITEKEAPDHIFGYCMVNDVSEREWQIEKMGQWVKGKSADTFGPMGPYLVTKDEIPDVQKLNLSLDVNGKRMQTGNTSKMIFNMNFILSYLSNFMSLQPGDIVTTGTPPGVGMGKKPQVFLKSGDEMSLSIDHLGKQHQKVK